MEVTQPQTLGGEGVQGRCGDLTSKGPDVRVAEVVGNDQKDVGSLGDLLRSRGGLPDLLTPSRCEDQEWCYAISEYFHDHENPPYLSRGEYFFLPENLAAMTEPVWKTL